MRAASLTLILGVMLSILSLPSVFAADACYSSIKDLPVTCTGTITFDSKTSSCRTVECASGSNTIKVLGCDKPGATNPTHFELYRQSSAGTPPKVCYGTTCIQFNGYQKSTNYPMCVSGDTCTPSTEVCDSKDNDCDGQIDEGNVCAPTCTPATETCNSKDDDCDGQIDEGGVCGTSTCHNSMKTIPATCERGTITQDTLSGSCRTIVCGSGSNSLKTLSCDKAGFFEMYKQAQTGTGAKICLHTTCIDGNGYAKSTNFPICTSGTPPPTGQPDLVGTSLSGTTSALAGDTTVTTTLNVKNQGGEPAPAGLMIRYYLSSDTTITTSDAYIGEYSTTSFIGAGETKTYTNSFKIPFNVNPGTYYYGAIIDELQDIPESNEGNNRFAGNTVQVNRPAGWCYQPVSTLPLYCNGGRWSSDSFSGGCRQMTCTTTAGGSISARACDVPAGSPTRFEVTRTSVSGTPPELCVGGACVSSSTSFSSSANYPACMQPTNAFLSIAEPPNTYGQPPGHDYYVAENFAFSQPAEIDGFAVYLQRVGAPPGNVEVRIETSNNSNPSGQLAHPAATKIITAGEVGTGLHQRNFDQKFVLNANTEYFLVIRNVYYSSSEYVAFGSRTDNPYGPGVRHTSYNAGQTWEETPTQDISLALFGRTVSVPTSLAETFSDGDYTSNPQWQEVRAPHGTTTLDASSGALKVERLNSNGFGEGSGITLATNIPVTDQTTAEFDVKVDFSSVRNQCGDRCTEFPANVIVKVRKTDGSIVSIYYAYNDDGGFSHTTVEGIFVAKGDAPTSTWLRDQQHRIRATVPDAQTIISVQLMGIGWDFRGWYDNIEIYDVEPVPPPQDTTDYGNTSSLFLSSGSLNGQAVSKDKPWIGVNPGQSVSGSVTVNYDNDWPEGTKVVMILTPNWGDRRASCTDLGTLATGTGSKVVPVSVAPPSTPGVYRVWIAFRAELDHHDVCSSTSWTVGTEVYGDHNDIATWEQSEFLEAQAAGRVSEEIDSGDHLKRVQVPATVVNVNVKSNAASGSSLTQNLHAYLHMNGELGDDVGGHNGIVIEPSVTFTSGKVNQAADFAADSSVQSRTYMQFTPQSTFALWAKFDGDSGAVWSWPGRFELFRTADGRIELRGIPRNAGVTQVTSKSVANGEWHHYAIIINDNFPASIADFYIDGAYQGSVNVPESSGAQPYMSLGAPSDRVFTGFSDQGFDGQIDELAVWERLLSEAEVRSLYNSGAGNAYPFGTSAPIYSACYAQQQDMPASCEGGTITMDGRHQDCSLITCSNGASELTVKACNKPGSYDPQFFEMYKHNYTGSAPLKICLFGTCFRHTDSFVKSPNFPICA